MSDWLDRNRKDSQRAKGELREYLYEIPIRYEQSDDLFTGTVLLRLTWEPSLFGTSSPNSALLVSVGKVFRR